MSDIHPLIAEQLLREARQAELNQSLREAARQGDAPRLAQLVREGADPFGPSGSERSALALAIEARELEASVFLARLADWDNPASRPRGDSPFCKAVFAGWEKGAKAFMPEAGFAKTAPQGSGAAHDAERALGMAAMEQNPQMIAFLLAQGLDPHFPGKGEELPLVLAAESGASPGCIRLLLDAMRPEMRGPAATKALFCLARDTGANAANAAGIEILTREAADSLSEAQAQKILQRFLARIGDADPILGRAFRALGAMPAFQAPALASALRMELFGRVNKQDWACADLVGLALPASDKLLKKALAAGAPLPQSLARQESLALQAEMAAAGFSRADLPPGAPAGQSEGSAGRGAPRL